MDKLINDNSKRKVGKALQIGESNRTHSELDLDPIWASSEHEKIQSAFNLIKYLHNHKFRILSFTSSEHEMGWPKLNIEPKITNSSSIKQLGKFDPFHDMT